MSILDRSSNCCSEGAATEVQSTDENVTRRIDEFGVESKAALTCKT